MDHGPSYTCGESTIAQLEGDPSNGVPYLQQGPPGKRAKF